MSDNRIARDRSITSTARPLVLALSDLDQQALLRMILGYAEASRQYGDPALDDLIASFARGYFPTD